MSCKEFEVPDRKTSRKVSNAEEIKSEIEVFQPGFSGFKSLHEVEDITDLYKFKKRLGSGSFGTVYSGRYLKTGTPVAIKMISKEKLKEKQNKDLLE